MGEMREFLRDDGASLQVVPGFRDRIHHWRPSVSPKSDWDDEGHQRAAASRVRRFEKRFKRLEEYQRFVHAYEGPEKAASRSGQIAELNQFTLERWREVVDDGNFGILEWEENPSAYAEEILGEFPELLDTLLPGVGERDVICGQINTVMRRSRG